MGEPWPRDEGAPNCPLASCGELPKLELDLTEPVPSLEKNALKPFFFLPSGCAAGAAPGRPVRPGDVGSEPG